MVRPRNELSLVTSSQLSPHIRTVHHPVDTTQTEFIPDILTSSH